MTAARRLGGLALLLVVVACQPTAVGNAPTGTPSGQAPSADASFSQVPAPSQAPSGGSSPLTSDPLHLVELVDVTSTTTFTLGALAAEGPVLLETMAIWCVNCRAQQHEVVAAHDLVDFHSVSLDVDPNERAEDLAEYSAAMGFDWRFAVATADLAAALRDRFGPAVLNPPSTPMILLLPDGTVRALEFRGHSADELAAEISAG
ncbi:MAG TPA: hypothetical protein VJ839_04210 [Candidatus Limnocylindria bacterium]|nr:hypothetical protein [Candidatus Limnocylindria bacterium]